MDDDGLINLEELRAALAERRQAELIATTGLYGGQERYFAAIRARNANDLDYQLARTIVRLLHHHDSPTKSFIQQHWQKLSADPPVAAFWQSVAAAGAEGWNEERRRIRVVEEAAIREQAPEKRELALDLPAVRSLMPVYRLWGKILLSAEAADSI